VIDTGNRVEARGVSTRTLFAARETGGLCGNADR